MFNDISNLENVVTFLLGSTEGIYKSGPSMLSYITQNVNKNQNRFVGVDDRILILPLFSSYQHVLSVSLNADGYNLWS